MDEIQKNKELEFYMEKGLELVFDNKHSEAIVCFDKAIQLDSSLARGYLGKAVDTRKLNLNHDVLNSYEKAIKIENFNETAFDKGFLLVQLNQHDSAIFNYKQCANDAIKLSFYMNLGSIYYNINNFSEAIKCYQKCLDINSNYSLAYNNKALVYLKLKRYNDAIKSLDRAIQLEAQYNKTLLIKEKSLYYERLIVNFISRLIVILISFLLYYFDVISDDTFYFILIILIVEFFFESFSI